MKINHLWAKSICIGLFFAAHLSIAAQPNAILFVESTPKNTKKVAEFGAQVALRNLHNQYGSIYRITSKAALFEKIQTLSLSETDIYILTDGNRSVLESKEVVALSAKNVRNVFIYAKGSKALAQSWKNAGAKEVFGYDNLPKVGEFYLARVFRLVGQGESLSRAIIEADGFSDEVDSTLGPYLSTPEYPSLNNVQVDLGTKEKFPNKTTGETDLFSMINSIMPTVSFDIETLPKFQALVEQIKGVSWEHLADLFPTGDGFLGTLPFTIEPGGPTAKNPVDPRVDPKDELWIDGETLKFYLSAFVEKEEIKNIIQSFERFKGVRIVRGARDIHVSIYLGGQVLFSIKDVKEAKRFQLYAVGIPKILRLSIGLDNNRIIIKEVSNGQSPLNLKLKVPFGPDSVYFHNAYFDIDTWEMQVEAGVVGDRLTLVGEGKVEKTKLVGRINLIETLLRNKGLLRLIGFVFRTLS
jgi:hypothetical protein